MPSARPPLVLHYTGASWDGNGIHAAIRQMAQTRAYRSVLGVMAGFGAEKNPRLPVWRGPPIAAETINLANCGRALVVAWRVRGWLLRGPHRIFHGHSRAGLLVGLWLRLLGVRRVVVSVHAYGRHRWFYRFARRVLGARLLWLTPAMKRHYGCADISWADCMPNGLGVRWVTEFRRWPGNRPLRIGGAGMMVRWKRWDLVLQALAALPPGRPVEFYHIGGAVDSADSRACEQELRELTGKLGLADRVHWQGWRASSTEWLGQVDVLVVPSDGEPFSMIALEALFAGVPVIATRGGGPEDFVREGENGWLVPPGDVGALTLCVEKCLQTAEWRGLRQNPEHIRRFAVAETLAPRWAVIYASI